MKSSPSSHPQAKAVSFLLLALVFWGLSFPLIKAMAQLTHSLVPGAGGAFITACILGPRFLLALPLLLLWERLGSNGADRAGPWTRQELRQGCWMGFFAAGGMLLQTDGLRFTAASTSAFLTQFYAILIPFWVALRRRQAPGLRIVACCILVFLGVAILSQFDWRQTHFGRGEWETLLASVFFMGQILSLENEAFAGNCVTRMTVIMFVILGVSSAVLAAASAPNLSALARPWSSPAWVSESLLLATFCTLGGFLIMNTWQPKISATEAGLLYSIEPIFGSLFALFLPALLSDWTGIAYRNESVSIHLVIGGGLITLANILVHVKPAQPPSLLPHPPQA